MTNSNGRFLTPERTGSPKSREQTRIRKGSNIIITVSFEPAPDADERLAKVARILLAHEFTQK